MFDNQLDKLLLKFLTVCLNMNKTHFPLSLGDPEYLGGSRRYGYAYYTFPGIFLEVGTYERSGVLHSRHCEIEDENFLASFDICVKGEKHPPINDHVVLYVSQVYIANLVTVGDEVALKRALLANILRHN